MNVFDNPDDRMKYLYEELRKIDDLHDAFRKEFEYEIIKIIMQHKLDFCRSTRFDEMLNQYATTILSTTFTVVDKDNTYPEYRKLKELELLHNLSSKIKIETEQHALAEAVLKKTKELAVKHCPKLFDLSAEGFRILDITLTLFNLDFIANIKDVS